ncbi:MAG TPA: addiction module protein [Pirellulales bacterium]
MATDASGLSGEAQQLFEAALRLPEPQRAKLADCLLSSVEPTTDSEWEKTWGDEIARRIAEIDNGTAELVSWEDLRQDLWETVHRYPLSPFAPRK